MRIIAVVFVFFLLGTTLLLSKTKILNYYQNNSDFISAVPITPTLNTDYLTPTTVAKSNRELETVIENTLAGTKRDYGIVVTNFKTGNTYSFNEHKSFEAASLYKLWVMAAAFEQIQNGTIGEDDILSSDIKTLNDSFNISSDSAELTTGVISLSVKNALEKMITLSHNYAALLLSKKIRLSTVSTFLEENGFYESTLGEPPLTTAYDINLFLEKLYRGELADNENTRKMTDLLKRQTINRKLPKYLPQGTILAHKTGELGYFTHDAGIVFSNNGDYIIVVLSESNSPKTAEDIIAKISKAVFDYFVSS